MRGKTYVVKWGDKLLPPYKHRGVKKQGKIFFDGKCYSVTRMVCLYPAVCLSHALQRAQALR